jgi:hypothetical protein
MNLGVYTVTSPIFFLDRNALVLVWKITDHKNTIATLSVLTPDGTSRDWVVSFNMIQRYLREETGLWGLRSQRRGDTTDGQ